MNATEDCYIAPRSGGRGRVWPMFLAAATVLVVAVSGCESREEDVSLIVHALDREVYQKDRSEALASYPGDERAVRHMAWYHRTEADVVQSFLHGEMDWSEATTGYLEKMHAASRELAEMYATLLAEARFELTPDEAQRRDRLNREIEEILGMLDQRR